MTDREAMKMALNALEFSLPAIEDFGSKEQLTDCHRAIMALYKSLAQPEQEPFKPDWVSYRQGVADGAAQPEQDEFAPYTGKGESSKIKHSLEPMPVAKHICNLWINPETSLYEVDRCTHPINEVFPVYTAPPRKEWVGLTDDEIKKIMQQWRNGYIDIKDVEQLLKEKNT
jgi:hypothetical protein